MKTRCFFFSLSSIFPEFSVFLGRSFVEGEEADMSGTWTMVDIAGRPGHVYEPPGGRPSLAVLYLHDIDAASLAERPAFTRPWANWASAVSVLRQVPRGGSIDFVRSSAPT